MVNESLDTEIRQALDAQAHEVDLPVDLASRTMQLAAQSTKGAKRSLRDRLRTLRDSRKMRLPASGYPRWMYAGAAFGAAIMLFAVGTLVTRDTSTLLSPAAQEEQAQDVADPPAGDTAGGQAGETRLTDEDQPSTFEAPAGSSDDAATTGGAAPEANAAEPGAAAESGDSASQRTLAGQTQSDSSGAATQAQPDTAIAPVPPVTGRPGSVPPKVVKTADIQVEVEGFSNAWSSANAVAGKHGGFVTNSNTEEVKDELARGTLTMRVPADKFQAAVDDLAKIGIIANQRTGGTDVSASIVDLQARVRTLEAEELQIMELLRRTNNVSEVLEIRNRLDGVRQEIESLKAQQQYFEDQVEFATINVTVFEQGAEPDDGDDGIIVDAWDTALDIGLTIVAGTLVVLGGLIPLAALGLAIWFVVRAVRRRRTTEAG